MLIECIVVPGLREVLSGRGGEKRRRERVMEWWQKLVIPVRRVWCAVSGRVKARKNGAGLLKLHDDIQTCGYEDVQIMWEMLRRTELEVIPRHSSARTDGFGEILLGPICQQIELTEKNSLLMLSINNCVSV